MWQPEERIKYEATHGSIPTKSDIDRSLLFAPFKSGKLNVSNRVWVPAMVPWRSNEEGEVTQDVLDWYTRFAAGQPGVIVVEATGIRDVPSGPLLRIGDDRYIEGLRRLTEGVKAASGGKTKIFIQLIDFLRIRRRPLPRDYFMRHLKVTRDLAGRCGLPDDSDENTVREHLLSQPQLWSSVLDKRQLNDLEFGARESVNDTHLLHIAQLPNELPRLFSDAAQRAKSAGFDGVELHYAHAYTMASFLSVTNSRADGFGGNTVNRLKVPLSVYSSVRDAVGDDFIVGCRMLADEIIEGGTTVATSKVYAHAFAEAGMDFISLSRGGKFDDAKKPSVGQAIYPYTGRSGYECMPGYVSDHFGPFGRNKDAAWEIRNHLRESGLATPIISAGGVHNFAMAEGWLADSVCDLVGMARQTLADPDWSIKVASGFADQVRLCEFTNYREGLDQKHKQVTCQLWDREALDDATVRLTSDGKRRLTAPVWIKPASQ